MLVDVPKDSDFSIHNLPFGVFSDSKNNNPRPGVAIGEKILDLGILARHGLFEGCGDFSADAKSTFEQPTLNKFMSYSRKEWRFVRQQLTSFISNDQHPVRLDMPQGGLEALVNQKDSKMHLPCTIGDYTDFYASKEHATNVGTMFRGKDNALNPNWTHLPIGYHGRASSIVVSGTPIKRPLGQRVLTPGSPPMFGPSTKLDIELEMAFIVGKGNDLGSPIDISVAEDYIFGLVLMNDWSARDIQAWEYVPLGPFLGKNFGTSISPWVVTLDALEPFKVDLPTQDPIPMLYLADDKKSGYDINLSVSIKPQNSSCFRTISNSNLKYLYWSLKQQLAHHTIGGCNMRPGDMCGTGTISAPTETGFGSLLELTWNGKNKILVADAKSSSDSQDHYGYFLEDFDTVKLEGYCEANGIRVGFGSCVGQILPSLI
ncbi:hypothetical protein BB560_006692 [Smittium megazygosporum]|uniref:Fumarylacetoacetase n=1 Tax=Smittium megazygosporum TaxID=133381 RepID=A0A2T9Y2E1_9FUNG|nr:hypothetical protein BB560_006692 [Smittium megazygosporum]